MNNTKIKFPISLKQIILFSALIILVLGVSTSLVSTMIRTDDRLNAEENNHTINGRTASTVEILFDEVISSSYIFSSALRSAEDSSERQKLIEEYFSANPNVLLSDYTPSPKLEGELLEKCSAACRQFFIREEMSHKVKFENYTEKLGIPSMLIIYPYEYGNYLSNGFVVIKTDFLSELMSTGANNSSLLIDSDCRILINPDFTDKTEKFEDAEPFIRRIEDSDCQNVQSLVKKNDGSNYFISVYAVKNGLFAVTTISEKAVYEVIDRTTFRIILFSLAVLFLAVIVIRIFSNTITYPIIDLVEASNKIEKGDFNLGITPTTRDEIGFLTSSFIQMGKGLAEREKLMVSFSKFTNKVIAEKAAGGELALGGENRIATIFFSDIRSFTAMSEKMKPHEVVDFLNQYMTLMVECVNRTGGVVDKYIGDAIMAVWGAPESCGDAASDALNAVTTALFMRESLLKFNEKRMAEGLSPVRIGCGINTGEVVAGQIGCEERMEYTVIGDAVNLASRTEALNKPFATDILITENTYELIKDSIIAVEMPGVHVKGKKDAVKMFAVVNLAGKNNPSSLDEVRCLIGTESPNLSKVNADDEEKKYDIKA